MSGWQAQLQLRLDNAPANASMPVLVKILEDAVHDAEAVIETEVKFIFHCWLERKRLKEAEAKSAMVALVSDALGAKRVTT